MNDFRIFKDIIEEKNNLDFRQIIRNSSLAACAPGERKITVRASRAKAVIDELERRGFMVERTITPNRAGFINIFFARVIL